MIKRTLCLILLLVFIFSFIGCETVTPQARRQAYIDEHPQLSEPVKQKILDGLIAIGMTEEQVVASLGKASGVKKNVSIRVVDEEWMYGPFPNCTYLHFDNGILIGIQNPSWQY